MLIIFTLRDNQRYGIFKANSSEGEIQIKISISGFGEEMEIIKNKKVIAWEDSGSCDKEDEIYEDDNIIMVDSVKVDKPFLRCLKRFK